MSIYEELLRRADGLAQQGHAEEAISAYTEAIEQAPEQGSAYYNLALLYHRQGCIEEAIAGFEKVAKITPRDASVFNNLGVLYYAREEWDRAERSFLKALEINPQYVDAVFGLGKVHFQQDRVYDAIIDFQRCLQIQPDVQKAASMLKQCQERKDRAEVKEQYRHILIVMDQGIGNMVMLTPTIRAIKQQLPEAHITVLGRSPSIQVVEGWDRVERVLTQPDDGSYDVGFLTIWSQEYGKLYGERLREQCKALYGIAMDHVDTHEADHHFKIARLLGYTGPRPEPFCMVKDVDLNVPSGTKLVGLSDTTLNNGDWERKRWPYYRELAERLLEEGTAVVLIGGKGEAERFDPKDWPDGVINALGKYDVQETAGLIQRCDRFIGNDSGPAHIAGALGVPTYVLFGPTRVTKNRPLGSNVTVLSKYLPCSPCQYTPRWDSCENWRCMREIRVDDVVGTIRGEDHGGTFRRPKKLVAMLRVKDAMETIRECLDHLSSFVDEIVIVDNGSTDGTLDVYTEYPKIVDVAHTQGYDEGRDKNLLLDMARKRTPDWIIWIDADEVLEKRMTRALAEQFMSQEEYTSIWFKQYHFWRDRKHYRVDDRWKPIYQRAMWQNQPGAFFSMSKVHNGLIQGVTGKRFLSDIRLKHYGHVTEEATRSKYELYRKVDRPDSPEWTGRTYTHMIDESTVQLAEWEEEVAEKPLVPLPASSRQAPGDSVGASLSARRSNGRQRLRIFAAFFHSDWEDYNLQPALEELGEVIRYNWRPRFNQYDPQWHWGKKQQMNVELFQKVQAAHTEKPLDVFFSYLSGRLVSPGIVRAIGMMGIPTLNIYLDCKTKFYGNLEPTGFAGMVDIANAFSLCWTSEKAAVKDYERVGAKAIYMPPGANPDVFHPYDLLRDMDVCFVGQKYGLRPQLIAHLREQGIHVHTFGRGWDAGEIPMDEVVRLFSRSKITLGVGATGNASDVVHIKGRDFEVPMSGGFYLTQYNPALEEFYEVGKEIVCYTSPDDLVEKIRYYLAHPQEAEEIRRAGLRRARRDHTWVGRFEKAFAAMGIPGFETGVELATDPQTSCTAGSKEPMVVEGAHEVAEGPRHIPQPPSPTEQQLIAELRESIQEWMSSPQINAASTQSQKDWRTWEQRLMRLIMEGDPRHFLNWDVILQTMFVGNFPFVDVEYAYLKNLPNWDSRWQRAIQEVACGRPIPYTGDTRSSPNLVHNAYHLAQFEEKTGIEVQDLDRIVEFGGGYGSMCRLAYNLDFRGSYVIIDLPAFSALQRYFLKSIGLSVAARSGRPPENSPGILLLTDINDLSSLPIAEHNSAFIATWSLSETPLSVRESVIPFLSSFNYLLIAYQKVFGEVDNVQYFSNIQSNMQTHQWHDYSITHMPGSRKDYPNRYLIGVKS